MLKKQQHFLWFGLTSILFCVHTALYLPPQVYVMLSCESQLLSAEKNG